MQFARTATSHHDIDRLGVASTADETVYRPVADGFTQAVPEAFQLAPHTNERGRTGLDVQDHVHITSRPGQRQPRVHGVHLKDFAEEGALADGCILGRGKLDLDAVFRALRAVGFLGPLSLEYERNPENVVPDLVACLEAASEAAERVALSV